MTSVRCPDERGNAPVNSFFHARRFADASARTVVAPNTDTLYSIAHLDLGKGPVTIGHPNMGRRYYSFELLDPYTNVIDIPGPAGGRAEGGGVRHPLDREAGQEPQAGRRPRDRVRVSARLGDREDARHRPQGPAPRLQDHVALLADAPERRAADVLRALQAGRAGRVPDPDRRRRGSSPPSTRRSPRTRRRAATTRCSPRSRRSASAPASRRRTPASTRRSARRSMTVSPRGPRPCRAARGCAPTPAPSRPRAGSCRPPTSATTAPITRRGRSSPCSGSGRTLRSRRSTRPDSPTRPGSSTTAPTTTGSRSSPGKSRRRSTSGR